MSWRDLVQRGERAVVAPWLGGRMVGLGATVWAVEGGLPSERGWYAFLVDGRRARLKDGRPVDPPDGGLSALQTGYMVGDRLADDGLSAVLGLEDLARNTERVLLLEDGLGRFARVTAGRAAEGGPLLYAGQAMPLGPEDEVARAYEDRLPSVARIPGVTPALDAVFRLETFQRAEAERRRAEIEERRREEERRLEREARVRELMETAGSAAGRRELARHDFGEAARAALAVGSAEYLDHHRVNRHEMAVRFRVLDLRLQCTCDELTLRIVDAGICLTDSYTRERGDDRLTLESLPSVVREAERTRQLVITTHVDGGPHGGGEEGDD